MPSSPAAPPDLIIDADLVLPAADQAPLTDHSVLVRAGKIQGIVPRDEARATDCAERIDCGGHALIPGLMNAHAHTPMSLLKGIADDLPLEPWLEQHIWPIEGRFVGEEFVRTGCQLAMAEMIRGGITTFCDMYFFPDVIAASARAAGMRAVVGLPVIEFPTAWANTADEYLHKGLELADLYKHDPLISTLFAPHATYTVAEETLRRISVMAGELDKRVQIHLHETAAEVAQCVRQHGMTPLQLLQKTGLINSGLLAVHMTQLSDAEIEWIAQMDISVVHCPESNHKLASGVCPVEKLTSAGVNVCLGTDGSASNNDLDLMGEMRTAAFTAKGFGGTAESLPAGQVLAMATGNAARALDLTSHCGTLDTGKSADMVAIAIDGIEAQPLYDLPSWLVYGASREQVRHVWVGGKTLLRERRLTTIDEVELLQRSRRFGRDITAFRQQTSNEHAE